MFSSAISRVVSQSFSKSRRVAGFHSTSLALDKLNVEGLAEKVNLEGQNVLMRVDLNVPLSKEASITIDDHKELPKFGSILFLFLTTRIFFHNRTM